MALTDLEFGDADADAAVRRTVRFGALVILTVFGGLAGWSLLFPLSGAVIAPGTVQVDGNNKTVQHLEGGIVKRLFVKEGDLVKAGAPLAELDGTAHRAAYDLVDGQYIELLARKARLEAERDDAADVAVPAELAARLGEPAVQRAIGGQLSLFHDRLGARESREGILRSRVAEYEEQIKGLAAQASSKERQVKLLNEERAGLKKLYEKGYASRTRMLALEREAESLMGEGGQAHAQMAALKTSVGEAEIEVMKARQEFRESVLSELREAEGELVKVLQQRVAAADTLRRTTVTAPADGRVLNLAVHTAGGVIAPGAALMEIVPEGDRLVVLAQIRPGDVGKIRAGESVHIRLAAFKARTTPAVDGKVLSVSADRVGDEKSGTHYVARVALPPVLPASFKGEPLKPGMPAEVFVRTGEQTAIGWLLRPLTDAFARTFRED